MFLLRRTSSASSASSCSSNMTTSTGNTSLSSSKDSLDIHHRRRISPLQQQALKSMFMVKSHPSRDERRALANELCMELKSVTVWFQNKRQMAKKNAGKENALVKRSTLHHKSDQYPRSTSSFPSSTLRLRRTTISLDEVAELNERCSERPATGPHLRLPLTPRTADMSKSSSFNIDKLELWEHMPSSPVASLTSPEVDRARLSIFSERSKTMRSLEWACAKARSSAKRDAGCVHELGFYTGEDGSDTDVDVEVITPDVSANLFLPSSSTSRNKTYTLDSEIWSASQKPGDVACEDVEAALLLLSFTGRR